MSIKMFTNAEVGDKVLDMKYKHGVIISTNYTRETPLCVKFDSGHNKHYTIDGLLIYNNGESINIQTLFWQEFIIPKEAFVKPMPQLEVDTKVLVWETGKQKLRRYFSHFDNFGRIWTFGIGSTSWSGDSVTPWTNWELYEEEKDNK